MQKISVQKANKTKTNKEKIKVKKITTQRIKRQPSELRLQKVLVESKFNITEIRNKIGTQKVSKTFAFLKEIPEYKRVLTVYGNKTVGDFLDSNRNLFLKIIKNRKLI